MTEINTEGRACTTTTTVIDAKNGGISKLSEKTPKKSVADDLAATFSSPAAWLLVVALIFTWSAVAIVMFDLVDYKSYVGAHQPGLSKAFMEAESPRGKRSCGAFISL
uniref:Triadin n=1 Tax=Erpetoichthys calabaricus TaxID=27687 RepID=A0A8C4RXC2_ERPCA